MIASDSISACGPLHRTESHVRSRPSQNSCGRTDHRDPRVLLAPGAPLCAPFASSERVQAHRSIGIALGSGHCPAPPPMRAAHASSACARCSHSATAAGARSRCFAPTVASLRGWSTRTPSLHLLFDACTCLVSQAACGHTLTWSSRFSSLRASKTPSGHSCFDCVVCSERM